ncbi:MAG: BatD family protein [Gemmatimonadota bacterium]
MIGALLLLALLPQQASTPQVMMAVDRDRVIPGEVITLTIRVSSGLPDPITMNLPSLGGFELESRSERTDVTTGPTAGRTTTYELKLRANTPGDWRLGPVKVKQGIAYATGDAVTVTVEGGSPAPVTGTLSRRLAGILQRAQPPDALGLAGISVVISDPLVVVGQQVDVVTIAWFDREVRQQLRRSPTVEEPQIDGVWSYPQPVPGGIAASRQVNGKWYDLFVLHQVVFPLTPGRVAIGPARLQYSVPLAFQFFSQEERYRLTSDASSFNATALPAEGRDPTFAGAVGHALSVRQLVTPASGRQGEAFAVELTVEGEGNVALWPQPDTRWPAGLRVYPEGASEKVTLHDGRLGGSKVFRFLLVADSAGSLALPPIRIAYFDPTLERYQVATSSGLAVVVAPRGQKVTTRAEPPPMRLDLKRPLAVVVRQLLPDAVWWLVALLPPLVLIVLRRPRRRRATVAPVSESDPLAAAERRLQRAMSAAVHAPEGLAQIAELHARVEAARFAPGAPAAVADLLRETEAALAQPAGRGTGTERRWRSRTGITVVLLLGCLGSLQSQTVPEQLYEAGAYRAAADGFRRRAVLSPDVTTHWFNLGDAAYRAGDDAVALAAWVRAARLSPRDHGIRRALLLVTPADADAGRLLWVAPVAPSELWLLGLVVWFCGWAGVLWTRHFRGRWLVLLSGGALLLAGGSALERWYHTPVAVVAANAQLRLSPHGLAPAVGEVPRLGTVKLGATRGGWIMVETSAGQEGWMLRDDLQSLAVAAEP